MERLTTSASNLFRRALCPGSAAAEESFPPEESSDAAEGTMLHELDASPEKIPNTTLTPEQLETLATAKRIDEEILTLARGSFGIAEDAPFEDHRETELWCFKGLKKIFNGHLDFARFYTQTGLLVIIDKKFGRTRVTSAETNIQLRAYAAMAAKKWKPTHIIVAINQPRLPLDQAVTMAEYRPEQFATAISEVISIWETAHNPDGTPKTDAPRVAGEDQCRYCRARLHCDAYLNQQKALFALVESNTDKDEFKGMITQVSNEQLDKLHVAIALANAIKEDVKKEIIRRMESGSMDNYELKPTGSTTAVSDPLQAFAILEAIGFTQEEIIRRCELAIPALAEDYYAKHGHSLAAAKRTIKNAIDSVLVVTPKSPSLKRKHAITSIASEPVIQQQTLL